MTNILDLELARTRKNAGMKTATMNKEHLLLIARDCAVWVARNLNPDTKTATTDYVAYRMQYLGYKYSDLGNAAGSIFKGKKWKFTGERIQSRRPAAHAREIKVWRLVE
tara:strand:- start:1642 stop:1968 length:327 start_codon:yes stop_codon:yes gene_type:complete